MRIRIFFILILIFFVGCSTSDNKYSSYEQSSEIKYDEASIRAIEIFRDADFSPFIEKELETIHAPRSFISVQPGFIINAQKSAPTRSFEVVLFKSHRAALNAVRINNLYFSSALEFYKGKESRYGIKDWWLSETSSVASLNSVSLIIIKENVVLSFIAGMHKYSDIEDELWKTATYFISLLDQLPLTNVSSREVSKTAIRNPDIIAAISLLLNDESKKNKEKLAVALNKGTFLALEVPNDISLSGPEYEGKFYVKGKDKKSKLKISADVNGTKYLDLFTDEMAIEMCPGIPPVKRSTMTASDAWEFVLNSEYDLGVMINPCMGSMPLSKDQVEYLYNKMKKE